VRRVKVADLSERGEKKGILGTLRVGAQDADKLVVGGAVNHQIQIYYNTKIFQEHLTLN
jgi:hypothetical protein